MNASGGDQEDVMTLQIRETVADPVDVVQGLESGVAWLIEKMLCKDREADVDSHFSATRSNRPPSPLVLLPFRLSYSISRMK